MTELTPLEEQFGVNFNQFQYDNLSPMTLSGIAKWRTLPSGGFLRIRPETNDDKELGEKEVHRFVLREVVYVIYHKP